MKRSRDSRERSPLSIREPKEARRSARDQYDDQRPSSSSHHNKSRDDDLSSNGRRWKDGKEVSPDRRRERELDERKRDRKRSHSPDESRRGTDSRDRDRRVDGRGDRKDRDGGRKHKSNDKERRRSKDRHGERNRSKEKESSSKMEIDPEVDEEEMMKLMGFVTFDSTKGKKVPGNDVSAVHVVPKRKYRQYMNRKGGFNRPLDYVT